MVTLVITIDVVSDTAATNKSHTVARRGNVEVQKVSLPGESMMGTYFAK